MRPRHSTVERAFGEGDMASTITGRLFGAFFFVGLAAAVASAQDGPYVGGAVAGTRVSPHAHPGGGGGGGALHRHHPGGDFDLEIARDDAEFLPDTSVT